MGTFTREELANHGKDAAETQEEEIIEETPAEETGDETVDEAPQAEPVARSAAAVEREQDEEPLLPPVPDAPPMPDMSDEDVAYDNDRYREKMSAWVKIQGRLEARRMLRDEAVDRSQRSFVSSLETKVAAFEKTHPDFKEKVRENTRLAAHQLHPEAGKIVARSKYTAELLYRFGSDLDLAIRTAKLGPIQQGIVIDRMISEIESEKARSAPRGEQRQQTLTRKPVTREQVLSGKQSMADIARASREKKLKSRFYGK